MAVVEANFSIRIGFIGGKNCLASSTAPPAVTGYDFGFIVPDGVTIPESPALIPSTENIAYSIQLDPELDLNTLTQEDILQLLHCHQELLDGPPQFSTYELSLPENFAILKPYNETLSASKSLRVFMVAETFEYSLEPQVSPVVIKVHAKVRYIKYHISLNKGAVQVQGKAVALYRQINLIAGHRTYTISSSHISNQNVYFDLTNYTLNAGTGRFYTTISTQLTLPLISASLSSSSSTYEPDLEVGVDGLYHTASWFRRTVIVGPFGDAITAFNHLEEDGYYEQSSGDTQLPDHMRSPFQDWGMQAWLYFKEPSGTVYSEPGHEQCILFLSPYGSEPYFDDQTIPDYVNPYDDGLPFVMMKNHHLVISVHEFLFGEGEEELEFVITDWRHPSYIKYDTWHHICIDYYNGNLNIAVDGVYSPVTFPAVGNYFPEWRWGVSPYRPFKYNFYGYTFDFYYHIGSYYKHQNFTPPTNYHLQHFGLNNYKLKNTQVLTNRLFSLKPLEAGLFRFSGRELDRPTLNGGAANSEHTTILNGGNASSEFPAIDVNTLLFDKSYRARTINVDLIGKNILSSLTDNQHGASTTLLIQAIGDSIQDVGYNNANLVLGPTPPKISDDTLAAGSRSIEFSGSPNCYVEVPNEEIKFNMYESGYVTYDFWIKFYSLDEAAELFAELLPDHKWDKVYSVVNYDKWYTAAEFAALDSQDLQEDKTHLHQRSLRIQSYRGDTWTETNPWKDVTTSNLIGLQWHWLPAYKADKRYVNTRNIGTEFQFVKGINPNAIVPNSTTGDTIAYMFSSNGDNKYNNPADSWVPSINTWYHLAIVKTAEAGSKYDSLYINGNLFGKAFAGDDPADQGKVIDSTESNMPDYFNRGDRLRDERCLRIGRNFDGVIQNFRITRGTKRFNPPFVPPVNAVRYLGAGDPLWDNYTASIVSANNLVAGGASDASTITTLYDYAKYYRIFEIGGALIMPRAWWNARSLDSYNWPNLVSDTNIYPTNIPTANSSLRLNGRQSLCRPCGSIHNGFNPSDAGYPLQRDFCIESWMYWPALPSNAVNPYVSNKAAIFSITNKERQPTTIYSGQNRQEILFMLSYQPDTSEIIVKLGTILLFVDPGAPIHDYSTEYRAFYPLNAETWYHMAFVRNGSDFVLYVNGEVAITINAGSSYDLGPSEIEGLTDEYPMLWNVGKMAYMRDIYLPEILDVNIYNVRLTLDHPRYTGAFTPSNTDFPVTGGFTPQVL